MDPIISWVNPYMTTFTQETSTIYRLVSEAVSIKVKIGMILFLMISVREQGQCETPAYRFLAKGGGWAWIKTLAAVSSARRGTNKAQTIICQHHQIT